MTDRGDPKSDQIVLGQMGKHGRVDVMVPERLGVLLKAQSTQPSLEVNRHVDRFPSNAEMAGCQHRYAA